MYIVTSEDYMEAQADLILYMPGTFSHDVAQLHGMMRSQIPVFCVCIQHKAPFLVTRSFHTSKHSNNYKHEMSKMFPMKYNN